MDDFTPAPLTPGMPVLVDATVDRLLTEAVHGIDAAMVRLKPASHAKEDDAMVMLPAHHIHDPGRLVTFATAHARLAKWMLERDSEAVYAQRSLIDSGEHPPEDVVVSLAMALIERGDNLYNALLRACGGDTELADAYIEAGK